MDGDSLIETAYEGDLELIKMLIKNGVDINYKDRHGTTCLTKACQYDKEEIVCYLIQSGANLDEEDDEGESLLHRLVYNGKVKYIKLFVDNGARLDVKYDGLTPLRMASICGQADVVHYLTGLPSLSPAAKVEALDLLGAKLVERGNLQSAHEYWLMALEERLNGESREVIQPKSGKPHPVYGSTREFNTVDQLNSIACSEDDMWIQAFIKVERILGPAKPRTCNLLKVRANAYLNAGSFDRYFSLWMYILDIQIESFGLLHKMTVDTLIHITRILSQLTVKDSPARYDVVMPLFVKAVQLCECLTQFQEFKPTDTHDYNFSSYFLVVLNAVGFLAKRQPQMSDEDRITFHQFILKFVNFNLRDHEEMTPLHWLFSCQSYSDCIHLPIEVTQLLLEAGADLQAVDIQGKTPLHKLCLDPHQLLSTCEIIQLVLEAGANPGAVDHLGNTSLHLYTMYNDHSNIYVIHVINLLLSKCCSCAPGIYNGEGKLFTDYLNSEIIRDIIKPSDFENLQCLSAKAALKCKIPYKTILPSRLAKFVQFHYNMSQCAVLTQP